LQAACGAGAFGGQRARKLDSPAKAIWPCRFSPGPRSAVASTKAFTCQLTVLLLLALKAGHARGHIDDTRLADMLSQLRSLPATINTAMEIDPDIRAAARDLSTAQSALFLGLG